MNYLGMDKCSLADGIGFRTVLWVSGCTLECGGCFNPESHNFNEGFPFTDETMREILDNLCKPYIDGLTLTGGNPLEIENLSTISDIITTVKRELPNKTIWLYTGLGWAEAIKFLYQYNHIDIMDNIDVMVDGRYIDVLRDVSLEFRGSSNQRIIDVKRSREVISENNGKTEIRYLRTPVVWS